MQNSAMMKNVSFSVNFCKQSMQAVYTSETIDGYKLTLADL